MQIKRKDNKIVVDELGALGCLLALIIIIFIIGAHFLLAAGITAILCWCFGVVFTWKIAIAAWIFSIVLTWLFNN